VHSLEHGAVWITYRPGLASAEAGPESAAVMTRVVAESRPDAIPFGVGFLWDPRIALATAVAAQASFIREVTTGVWESDLGLWNTNCAHTLRERRRLHAEPLAIFVNVTPEFASPIGTRSAAATARSTATSSLADAMLVSGPMAGAGPDLSTLQAVRGAAPDGRHLRHRRPGRRRPRPAPPVGRHRALLARREVPVVLAGSRPARLLYCAISRSEWTPGFNPDWTSAACGAGRP
jgi:hypothetical protein